MTRAGPAGEIPRVVGSRRPFLSKLVLCLAVLTGPAALASPTPDLANTICGLFQSEDFAGEIVYSITTFSGPGGRQIRHTIRNPENPDVRGMMRGMCYCVTGPDGEDPAFAGDSAYRRIWVESVPYGPYSSCSPFNRSH